MSDIHPPKCAPLTSQLPNATTADGAISVFASYFPGRCVSVQFRLPAPGAILVPEPRVRIMLLFEPSAICERILSSSPANPQRKRLHGPIAIVVPGNFRDKLLVMGSDRLAIIYIEPWLAYQTASDPVNTITSESLALLCENDAMILQLKTVLENVAAGKVRPGGLYIEGSAMMMATHVLQAIFGVAPSARRDGLPFDVVCRVVAYIDENCIAKFDVEKIAQAAGVSRRHLQRLFEKSLNRTLLEHFRAAQVQRAVTLLQTTDWKGLDVALACGFCDETQMARWFRKVHHCLPSGVREALRGHGCRILDATRRGANAE